MAVVIGAISGFLAGRLMWILLRDFYEQPAFLRSNYRAKEVPTAGGLVLLLAVLVVESGRAFAGAVGVGERLGLTPNRLGLIVIVLGFGLVGIVDDIAGDSRIRGFRGHLSALSRGNLTTGTVKIIGGGLVALIVASEAKFSTVGTSSLAFLRDAAMIALSANLGNLLDRAPGRVLKVGGLTFAFLIVFTLADSRISPMAVAMGAALSLMLDDLHERVMLGDSGANLVGAVVGAAIVFGCSSATRSELFVVVLVLNVLSEFISFSKIIDGFPPLRVLDEMGRHKAASRTKARSTAKGPGTKAGNRKTEVPE